MYESDCSKLINSLYHSDDLYQLLRCFCYFGDYESIKVFLNKEKKYLSANNFELLRFAVSGRHPEVINLMRQELGNKIPCYNCLVSSMCTTICF